MVRRKFLLSGAATAGALLAAACTSGALSSEGDNSGSDDDQRTWRMSEEGEPHERTWMAFGASEAIWGAELLPEVRRNLATIAQTIAQFEPVSMLVRSEDSMLATPPEQMSPSTHSTSVPGSGRYSAAMTTSCASTLANPRS